MLEAFNISEEELEFVVQPYLFEAYAMPLSDVVHHVACENENFGKPLASVAGETKSQCQAL